MPTTKQNLIEKIREALKENKKYRRNQWRPHTYLGEILYWWRYSKVGYLEIKTNTNHYQ